MDTQPPSQPNSDKTNPNQGNEINPQNLPSSILNLKLEVEKIYRDVDQLRKLLQTLVTGLILAIIVSLSISSWFAYRLLLQERIFQRQSNNSTKKQEEIVSNLENLKIQVQSQNEQLQSLKQQIPEDLQTLLLNYEQQIKKLSERLEELELKKLETEENPPNELSAN